MATMNEWVLIQGQQEIPATGALCKDWSEELTAGFVARVDVLWMEYGREGPPLRALELQGLTQALYRGAIRAQRRGEAQA